MDRMIKRVIMVFFPSACPSNKKVGLKKSVSGFLASFLASVTFGVTKKKLFLQINLVNFKQTETTNASK